MSHYVYSSILLPSEPAHQHGMNSLLMGLIRLYQKQI